MITFGDQRRPLDFLLTVVADNSLDVSVRLRAAAMAAPYCHRRLAEVAVERENVAAGNIAGLTLRRQETATHILGRGPTQSSQSDATNPNRTAPTSGGGNSR